LEREKKAGRKDKKKASTKWSEMGYIEKEQFNEASKADDQREKDEIAALKEAHVKTLKDGLDNLCKERDDLRAKKEAGEDIPLADSQEQPWAIFEKANKGAMQETQKRKKREQETASKKKKAKSPKVRDYCSERSDES